DPGPQLLHDESDVGAGSPSHPGRRVGGNAAGGRRGPAVLPPSSRAATPRRSRPSAVAACVPPEELEALRLAFHDSPTPAALVIDMCGIVGSFTPGRAASPPEIVAGMRD